jgi:hypothetical protein
MSVNPLIYHNEVILVEGVPTIMSVPEAQDGVLPGRIGERSYKCTICGRLQREHDIVPFRGKLYGRQCGCYKDIQSILTSEKEAQKYGRVEGSDSGIVERGQ